jgi:uncharacterized protein (UPF0303 family)
MGTLSDARPSPDSPFREFVQAGGGVPVVTEEADVSGAESIDGEEKDVVHHALLVT